MILLVLFITSLSSVLTLEEAFAWNYLHFPNGTVPSDFVPIIPSSFEVYKKRIFVAIPVVGETPVTLGYVNFPVKNNTIQPYPDETSQKNITSSIYIKKDKFDRLWVLDCGAVDILGDKIQINPPKLLTYSLTTNQLIRTFTFPKNQYTNDSLFVYLAVETVTEQDTFVYIADIANNLLVYDWKQNTSKVISDETFKHNPNHVNFEGINNNYNYPRGLSSMSLTGLDKNNYSTLYYNPLASVDQFAVNTRYLRDSNYTSNAFVKLGTRSSNKQISTSAYYPEKDILFYGLAHKGLVYCWNSHNNYEEKNLIVLYNASERLPTLDDMKVDGNKLWLFSNQFTSSKSERLFVRNVNFRLMIAQISDNIKKCERKIDLITPSGCTKWFFQYYILIFAVLIKLL